MDTEIIRVKTCNNSLLIIVAGRQHLHLCVQSGDPCVMQLTQEEGGGGQVRGNASKKTGWVCCCCLFFYRRIYCSVAAAAGVDLASFL